MSPSYRLIILIFAALVCILSVAAAWAVLPSIIEPPPAPVEKPDLVQKSPNFVYQPTLESRAAFSLYLAPGGREMEVLLAKNAEVALPLASVTKLVTALVARENYLPTRPVTVRAEDLTTEPDPSFLRPGDVFTIRSLLYPLLVESSNDAAQVLARQLSEADFIKKMNSLALAIGMTGAEFYNPSGLDPALGSGAVNRASARDLGRLGLYLLSHDRELLDITTLQGYQLFTADGQFHHQLRNTDQLLNHQEWPADILGGKTGTTDLAKRNLFLILRDRQSGGYLINVILGADDNFAEMKKLIDWVYQSYKFAQT